MSEIVTTNNNPFGQPPRALAPASATARTDEQRAIAEVQAALVVARANPRDQMLAWDRIKNACQRPGLAEHAVYSYAKGGTDVSGPSIRLAEAIAQSWGNLQFGIRELEQAGGVSTVQAFCWDVETNTRREVTFQVRHERHTRSGKKKLDDPREVYELVANQGARRVRACILAVIPGDVVEMATSECEKTLKARADTSEAGVAKLVQAFADIGVTKQMIEARIQRRMEAITPAQVVNLRKVFTSLRDGMSTIEEWFPADAAAPAGAVKQAGAPEEAVVEESSGYEEPEEKPKEKPKQQRGRAKKEEPAPEAVVTETDVSPPANEEQAKHDAEAEAQAQAAAASPPAGTLAIPIDTETRVLLPFEAEEVPEAKGTLLYDGKAILQWDGKAWLPFVDQALGYDAACRYLHRLHTHRFKRIRMEREQAFDWIAETLGLAAPPTKLADLTLDQLVALTEAAQ